MTAFRFCVSVMPKPGILDPQGRAVEQSLPHLHVSSVTDVRVGRRVELTVEAPDDGSALVIAQWLAAELFANPLIETWSVERVDGTARPEAEAVSAGAEAAR